MNLAAWWCVSWKHINSATIRGIRGKPLALALLNTSRNPWHSSEMGTGYCISGHLMVIEGVADSFDRKLLSMLIHSNHSAASMRNSRSYLAMHLGPCLFVKSHSLSSLSSETWWKTLQNIAMKHPYDERSLSHTAVAKDSGQCKTVQDDKTM